MPTAAASCRAVEHLFERAFEAAANPLKQLGALATMLFVLLAVTGAVLYIVLDTSASGAYRSIEAFSRERAGFGSIVRGLHRYAADAFALVTLAHVAREWALGRFKAFRRYSWLTGVPLLPLLFGCAIVGFWLNWDRLAQHSALATAELLDALPLLAAPLARNFLGEVSDRLFSLFVFVHIGVPLLLVFGLWFHLQRISRPRIVASRAVALGTAAALFAVALLLPVRSQGAADASTVPAALALDWVLLFLHPLADASSPAAVWLLLASALAVLFGLPFLSPRHPQPAAVVDPAHCNGCRRCMDDCPYGAITLAAHPNGRPGWQVAVVDPLLCAACGICVGACPSATPLRRAPVLATGIDLPLAPLDSLRRRLDAALAARPGAHVLFGCMHGAAPAAAAGRHAVAFELECAGMLPPSFVDYALRRGAGGVLVAACRTGGCEFRTGERWTAQRLGGERAPRLRAGVAHDRWAAVFADAGEEARVTGALAQLRERAGATS